MADRRRQPDVRRKLSTLARPLERRYLVDPTDEGRARWVAIPVDRSELDADPLAALGRVWPIVLAKADAIGSIPTGEPPEVLSPAEMRRRDPGAWLWRSASWWLLFYVRQQTDDDVVEVVVDLRDEDPDAETRQARP